MDDYRIIGINGFGRVGKLLSWQLIATGHYRTIVINTCTPDISMDQLAGYVEKDSTYGWLKQYLYGSKGSGDCNMEVHKSDQRIVIDGVNLIFLTEWKRPQDIPWRQTGVSIVVDATGQFLDPIILEDSPAPSLRGHFKAGAKKVIVTSPFKLDEGKPHPENCLTTVMGINDADYYPEKHDIISIASCTTTCLAHMVKPLLDGLDKKNILSFSMVTVHALTAAQPILDQIPQARSKGKKILQDNSNERFNRSGLNNIILTSTGATKSLRLILPEMEKIGFIAQSVRVPVSTGSLIIMTVNIQDGDTNRKSINEVYQKAAQAQENKYLRYSDKPHVSEDIKGLCAAAMIEGCETHTRKGEAEITLGEQQGAFKIPITQATIHGWYDNELGNYVYMLSKQLDKIY